MADLDKFKRRLIRSVARMIFKEQKSTEEVWSILSEQTGRDVREIWKRMEALCLKKLSRLLAADDYVRHVGPVARMTITDWLMFDMVLVHNQPDVCTLPKDSTAEPSGTALLDLLYLAEVFDVENVPTADCADAWSKLTAEYNKNGRESSPMLLQLRWYQMKAATRISFYKFWSTFRGSARNLPKAEMPSKLHLAVVKKFPNIVVTPFTKWETLVAQGRIVLLDQLIRSKKSAKRVTEQGAAVSTTDDVSGEPTEPNADQSDPDLLLLEPKIDTITLDDESDCENTGPEGDKVATTESDTTVNAPSTTDQNNPEPIISQYNIEVHENLIENSYLSSTENEPREERVEIDGLLNVKILETSHIPTEEIHETGDIEEAPSAEITDECSLLAKETDNASKALSDLLILDQSINNTDIIIDDSTEIKNVENGNSVQETTTNSLETQDNLSAVQTAEVDDLPSELLPCEKAEDKNQKESENVVELSMDEIEKTETRDDLDRNIDKEGTTESYRSKDLRETKIIPTNEDKEIKFHPVSELPSSIELLDDGIDLCEDEEDDLFVLNNYDDIERKTVAEEDGENLQQYVPETAEEKERSNSCFKLLMNAVVYTTKLEHMAVLKHADFENVKSVELIEAVIVESKPVSEHFFHHKLVDINGKEEVYPNTIEEKPIDEDIIKLVPNADEDGVSNQDELSENQRVNIDSDLFKKPTYRNYNSILLCKNPDFNTRLKRLSVGFFTSERNRQLYNTCKPLTVDLQKSFEMRLINGTIRLNQNESNVLNGVREQKVYNNQPVSIIPSALPAQCLIDKTRSDIQQLISPKSDAKNTYEIMDNVDNGVKQELLTAEVPPIEGNIKTSSGAIDTDTVKGDNITHVPELTDSKQIIKTNVNVDVDVKVEAPSKPVDLNMNSTKNTVLSLEISPLFLNIPPRTVTHSPDIHSSINTSVSDVSVKITNTTSIFGEIPMTKTITNTIDSAVGVTATVHNTVVSNVHETTQKTKKASKQNNTNTPWYVPTPIKRKKIILTPSIDDEACITSDSLFSMIQVMEGNWYEGKKKDKKSKATAIEDKSETHAEKVSRKRKSEKSEKEEKVDVTDKPKKNRRRKKEFCCWALEKYCIHIYSIKNNKRRKTKLEPKMKHDCGLICSCCCRNILANALREFKLNDDDAETVVETFAVGTNTESNNETSNPIPNASVIPYEDCDEHDNQEITEVPTLHWNDINEKDTQANENENLFQITETRKSPENVAGDHVERLTSNENMESIVLSDDDDSEKIITANYLESKWTKIVKSAKPVIKPDSSYLSVSSIPVTNSLMTKYTIKYKKSLMSRCPLKLGKDQVLLTSVILPPHLRDDDQGSSELIGVRQNADRLMIPEILLPKGVSMSLQPNGLVNAVIENGIELQYDDVQKTHNVLTTVQKQINAHFGLSRVIDTSTFDVNNTIGSNIIIKDGNLTTPNLVDESLTILSTVVSNGTTPVLAPEITNQSCANVLTGSQENNESFNVVSESSIDRNDDSEITINDQVTANDQSGVSDQVTKSDQVMTNVQCSVSDQNAMSDHDTVNDQVTENAQITLNEQTSVSNKVAINDENIVNDQPQVVDVPNEVGGGGKKSILSDLMEMSGISSEDVQPSTNLIEVSGLSSEDVQPSMEIQMPFLYPGLNKIDVTNEASGNVLTQVTTVEALKYAYGQKGQFFRFNTKTKSIMRIDVAIKRRKRIIVPVPRQPSQKLPAVIDLTSSGNNEIDNDVQTGLLSEISKLKTEDICMLRKHIQLRNLNHYGRAQATTNINQGNAMIAEYLDSEEDHHEDFTFTENHKRTHEDSDSDDEPLANKVRRKENRYEETTVNTVASDDPNEPEYYDVDVLDEDFLSDASGECILGA